MKRTAIIGFVFGSISSVCAAGPVNISQALELVSATDTVSALGNGAASYSSLGIPGVSAQEFSGSLSTSASVNIDRFNDAYSTATLSWNYAFRITQPLIGDISVSYTYGYSDGVYSNLAATAGAGVFLYDLIASIVAPNGYVYGSYIWSAASDTSYCNTSWPNDCASGQFTQDGLGGKHEFSYSPGYAVGSLLTLSGAMRSSAYADTYLGSANANGSTWLSFSAKAISVPPTISLLLVALIPLFRTGRAAKAVKRLVASRQRVVLPEERLW